MVVLNYTSGSLYARNRLFYILLYFIIIIIIITINSVASGKEKNTVRIRRTKLHCKMYL